MKEDSADHSTEYRCIDTVGTQFFLHDGKVDFFTEVGKEDPPAVTELIRDLEMRVASSSGPAEVDDAINHFRLQYQLVVENASRAKNMPTADSRAVTAPNKLEPPKIAEFLLTALAANRQAEAMTGDLNERFADECEKFGRQRAVRLYWARTLRSLWPLLKRAIGKALKWGAVIAAVRRLF
jgi:hypothetical protein